MDRDIISFEKSAHIDRWFYSKPSLTADERGEIILIHQYSFGPLEWQKSGIDAKGRFFEQYCWCEDDFYEEANYKKEISKDTMLKKIRQMQSFFAENDLPEYADMYRQAENIVTTGY